MGCTVPAAPPRARGNPQPLGARHLAGCLPPRLPRAAHLAQVGGRPAYRVGGPGWQPPSCVRDAGGAGGRGERGVNGGGGWPAGGRDGGRPGGQRGGGPAGPVPDVHHLVRRARPALRAGNCSARCFAGRSSTPLILGRPPPLSLNGACVPAAG